MDVSVDPAVRMARVPRLIPRVDVAIMLGLLAWAVLEAVFASGSGTTAERLVFAFGFSVPVVLRRRFPFEVLLLIAALAILRPLVLGDSIAEEGAMPFPALLLMTFSAGLYAQPRWLAFAAIPLPILAIVFAFTGESNDAGVVDYAILSFFAIGAWTGGWLVRRRAAQVELARAESGVLAREAVSEERQRIARELHDVVAHSVSIVAVQAGAAEQQLDVDPERAREHLAAVRTTAREAMTEMRRLLDVLREEDAPHAPQPGLARLPDLIAEAEAAGTSVELRESGERAQLPAGVDLVAYRIVQEALTNARKHAGRVPAVVAIDYAPGGISLEIVNGPGKPDRSSGTVNGDGHGLVGMRERVRLYGGTVETGPEPDGGFAVRARLPVEVGA